MNDQPPKHVAEKKPFAFTAANVGLALLLGGSVVFVLGYFKNAAKEADLPLSRETVIIFSGLGMACYLAGLVFSIMALCGIPHHGRAGLLGRGIAGLLLNGGSMLATTISLTLLWPGLQEAKSLKQFDNAANTLKQSIRDSINPSNGAPNSTAALDKFIATSTEAAKNLKGPDAVTMQAGLSFFAKLKVENDAYTQSAAAMQNAEVLNGETLKAKDQIAPRRKIVQTFLDANQRLREFVRDSEQHFEAELKTRSVVPGDIDQALTSFRKGAARNTLVLKIRDSDERIGKSMLTALTLVEQQWDRWKFDKDADKFTFEDAAAQKEYVTSVKEIENASEVQTLLKQQLLGTK